MVRPTAIAVIVGLSFATVLTVLRYGRGFVVTRMTPCAAAGSSG